MLLRRLRGFVLRLVRRRALAIAVGLALAAPAVWVEFSGRFGAWWTDGLALVVGATGLAIFWTGLTGAAPDWVDDSQRSQVDSHQSVESQESVDSRQPDSRAD